MQETIDPRSGQTVSDEEMQMQAWLVIWLHKNCDRNPANNKLHMHMWTRWKDVWEDYRDGKHSHSLYQQLNIIACKREGYKPLEYKKFTRVRAEQFHGATLARDSMLARCTFCQNNLAERQNPLTTEERHKQLEEEYADHQCKQTDERVCYHIRRLLSKEKRNSTLCIALDHAAKKRVLNIFPHKKNQNLDDYLELSPGTYL